MARLGKDNTLFYLLFVIAVFIIISLAKAPKKAAKEEKEEEDDPRVTPPKVDSNKTYISNGQKYENKAEPQPSVPGSDQYDYNQEGLAGTLNKGQYTK